MFSFLSGKSSDDRLRQQCLEWFSAHRVQLVTYARQQADAVTDIELLLATVVTNVTRAACEGRVSIEELHPYALRSIFNAAARLREQNVRRRRTEHSYSEMENPMTEHAALTDGPDDRQLQLRRAVQQLCAEQAEVVTMRIWDELAFTDIAARLNLPESTVRSRYTAALKQIKSRIFA